MTVTRRADKKPQTAGGEGNLNIRIRDQTGEETCVLCADTNRPRTVDSLPGLSGHRYFKVKKSTKLEKVFNAYSTRKGVAPQSLRFLFDGQRVGGHQTPQDLDMDDGDQLDCMCGCVQRWARSFSRRLEQQGGL